MLKRQLDRISRVSVWIPTHRAKEGNMAVLPVSSNKQALVCVAEPAHTFAVEDTTLHTLFLNFMVGKVRYQPCRGKYFCL